MAVLADAKTVYGSASTVGGFSNEETWIKVQYNFANDTGGIADYTVFTAGADLVITDFFADVTTAATSAGSLVVDLGVGAGGTGVWSDKAVADLTLNSFHGMDTVVPLKVAAAGTVQLGLEAAAATAGVIDFHFKVRRLI